jgi:hypothetical protein
VFQVHHIDPESGEIVNSSIKRAAFPEHFANCEPCMVDMEACCGRLGNLAGRAAAWQCSGGHAGSAAGDVGVAPRAVAIGEVPYYAD